MTQIKILTLALFTALGLTISATDANAQYTPGFQIQRTRISPFGGIASESQIIQPYYGGTQSQQSNYFNPWTGVTFGQQIILNSYGTTAVTQSYDPWVGPTYWYQFAPTRPVNAQMAYFYGHPLVVSPQVAAFNNARFRPGFTWNSRYGY